MTETQHEQQNPACPECKSTYVVRKGKRRNRVQLLQLFQCGECRHRFTGDPGRNKTYPLKYVLEALSTYNRGYSITETTQHMRRKSRLDIPVGTVRSWLAAYRPFTTYARLRTAGRRLYDPRSIVTALTLEHKQVYEFQVHRAKLDLLLDQAQHQRLAPIKRYLTSDVQKNFPHHLFREDHHRSSTFPTDFKPPIERKENTATRMASLVLSTSPAHRKRHETLQRFMLLNDSVTVAVEGPVYLTPDDIARYAAAGFNLGFQGTFITGHIDFLQIRNGHAHILDYKPEAKKEKHAHVQLTIYALALSRRVGLPVKFFKCAWFDEHDYFEFFPLQGVYQRHPRRMRST